MKLINKQIIIFLSIVTLFLPIPSQALVTRFKMRPQSLNGARKVAGELPGTIMHRAHEKEKQWPDYDPYYLGTFPEKIFDTYTQNGILSIALAYQHSFNPNAISQSLFGNLLQRSKKCDTRSLIIQGTRVEDRDPKALRADDFYLSDQYDGSISFKPTISNFIVDFNCYVDLNKLFDGMYFRIYAPFVHTRWDLHAKETINATNPNPDQAINGGRFSPEFITNENVFSSALDFFNGKQVNDELDPAQTLTIGDNPRAPYVLTRHPLLYNTFNTCQSNTKNGFGEIRAELGWDFLQNPNYHLGVYLAGAIPTGNHISAQKLFAPTVGNGKHGELGGGLTGHYLFWQSENEKHQIGVYTDIVITHLFNAKEERVFDLKSKPLSRYMLASKHIAVENGGLNTVSGLPVNFGVPTPTDVVAYRFIGEFTSVANLTKQTINTNIGAQLDATIWLNYTTNNVTIDGGYNLWLQTGENVSCTSKCAPRLKTETTWALHGDAQAFGYFGVGAGPNRETGVTLAASESQATITTGTNESSTINDGIDNPLFAYARPNDNVARNLVNFKSHRTDGTTPGANLTNHIKLSSPALFISMDNIDRAVQTKTALSHKLFTNVSYIWDREGIIPFFGIGGEVEFGTKSGSCNNVASLSQWGVWTKIGLSFD